MYRVRDLMTRRVLYVTPQATVQAAMDLLRFQQLEMLPVVQEGLLVGVLDSLSLYRFHGELPVREVMADPVTTEADSPLGEAASLMLQHRVHQIPVVEENRLVGLLSHRELIGTWGAYIDARTGLPGVDFLRRWASGHLTAGREVALLFIDIDNFGAFNKLHGHLVGDSVLKAVAAALREQVDPHRETLCRYGGDEFAIATTRTQEEAWGLAHTLHEAVAQADYGDARVEARVSVGIAGGKRHVPRPGTHPSANVDDLINWASRASTRAKTEPGHVVVFEGTGSDGPEFVAAPSWADGSPGFSPLSPQADRIVVEDYTIRHAGPSVEVTVHLRLGEETHTAAATHTGGEILLTVAGATGACLQSFLTPAARLSVPDIRVHAEGEAPGFVTAWVRLQFPNDDEWLIGAVPLQEDRYRSVVNAVLDATNRRMGWLGQFRIAAPPPEAAEAGAALAP
jgi:diguanylate cyclase (GGDEF)-like protein